MTRRERTLMEQANEKKRGRMRLPWEMGEFLGADTAVLRRGGGAAVYGCHRILSYSPTRICLAVGKRRVTVFGDSLLCTSFSARCVTVEGEVEGIHYCNAACKSECPWE